MKLPAVNCRVSNVKDPSLNGRGPTRPRRVKGRVTEHLITPRFTLLNKDGEEFVTYLFYEYLFSL